jgi:ubiquinone/menaquinone biosynthesis C-methylase UbiE
MPNLDLKAGSATTLPPEKWGLKESADWWSAGQRARQAIYESATERMLDLADVKPSIRVLDVAAGTGESTVMAARRVGPSGYVLGVDVSESMLNVAAETARKEGITSIETQVMSADTLTLDADSFDAVICRIALMLFPNPLKALTEMRRVAKTKGKVAVIVYSAPGEQPVPWHFL